MLYLFLPFEAAHEGIFQSAAQWTWSIQSQRRHDVIFTARMDLTQCGAHAWTFDLETANRFATSQFVVLWLDHPKVWNPKRPVQSEIDPVDSPE